MIFVRFVHSKRYMYSKERDDLFILSDELEKRRKFDENRVEMIL